LLFIGEVESYSKDLDTEFYFKVYSIKDSLSFFDSVEFSQFILKILNSSESSPKKYLDYAIHFINILQFLSVICYLWVIK
jgi:hypothetical protein